MCCSVVRGRPLPSVSDGSGGFQGPVRGIDALSGGFLAFSKRAEQSRFGFAFGLLKSVDDHEGALALRDVRTRRFPKRRGV